MLHEITRRSIIVSKHEESIFNQHNSLLALRGDKQLHILEFSYNVLCLDKKLDLVESAIACPKNSVTTQFSKKYASKGISNMELVECISNPYLWPYSDDLRIEMTNIIAFEWSPSDLIYNNKNVLAILNSVGNIEFYGPQNHLWVSLKNFSCIVKQYIMSEPQLDLSKKCKNMDELKEIVYCVSTSAICWCPNLNSDGSCLFVTAQRNSTLMFWSLKFHNSDLSVELLEKVYVNFDEIKTLAWIPYANNIFIIIYANIHGQVFGRVYKIQDKKINEQSTVLLWKYRDRMVPKNVQFVYENEKLLIIYAKHRHLVVQMLDDKFNLLSEAVNVYNDEKISVLTKTEQGIYIGTINMNIYKLNLVVSYNAITVKYKSVILKDSYINHDLYGLVFTNNNMICHLILADRKVNIRKEQTQMYVVSLSAEDEKLEKVLLENLSKNLTNMWDCIELLRYRTLKMKKLPALDYDSFYKEAATDTYKLKLYLILVKLYNSLEGSLKNHSKGLLPETSVEVVQDKLLAIHAKETIMKIYEKHKNNTLDYFEKEWLSGSCIYLQYHCKIYEISQRQFITDSVWKVVIDLITNFDLPPRICIFCDDTIEVFKCSNHHTNMLCSVTFTQIDGSEYLACKSCDVIARIELYQYKQLCVFCDSPLNIL